MADSRRAVVIGVNKYADQRLPTLSGAVNDAKELKQKLQEFGEFEIPDGHFLLDDQATCKNIRRAISDLLWKTDPSDVSLFYFSGHGLQDGYQNGYIAPCDIVQDQPLVSGIRMDELRSIVVDAKGKGNVIVILDCCYSGIATSGAKAGPSVTGDVVLDTFSPKTGQAQGSGWIILASSGKDEKSRERLDCTHEFDTMSSHPHGWFSYYLLQGLNGLAPSTDGKISLGQLEQYVSGEMRKADQPDVKFLAAGDARADQVIIATASQLGRVKLIIAAADQDLEREKAWAVFNAVDVAYKVLQMTPRLEDALGLKQRVDDCLKKYSSSTLGWVLDHKRTIGENIRQQFADLQKSASQLSVDFIVDQTPQWQGLLQSLCEVTDGDMDEKTFLALLSAVRQGRPPAPPEGRMTVK